MSTLNTATLKLFNAIQTKTKKENTIDWAVFQHMIANGYIVDSAIKLDSELISLLDETVGIGGVKLNSTFHKSWGKVKDAPLAQLVIEQIVHYITTYGFEALGIYDEKHVYIPAEKLDVPEVTEDIPLVFIRALSPDEVVLEAEQLGSAGIALSKETLDNLMIVVEHNKSLAYDIVPNITNREFLTRLCDFYDLVPSEPMAYLRYVVMKLTKESLIIKNKKLIEMIKASNSRLLDDLIDNAPEDLATIFFRFKPLFLAMKSASSRNKSFFNALRKKAERLHEPLQPDFLNNVTGSIKNKTFSVKEFNGKLNNYSVWRKVRLAYALNNRLTIGDSIVYKVRNGKAWVSDFNWKGSFSTVEKVLNSTLESIANDIQGNVAGRTFFIPENVHYSLPATEKQFTGNVPANSYVSVGDKNLVVGVHWYNKSNVDKRSGDNNRVDIDLSLLDAFGKYGWDRHYRSDSGDVLFSGDVTDAPRPRGASEFFYMSGLVSTPKLINANHFTHSYFRDGTGIECQLIVAQERPSSKRFERNYMVDQNNILFSQTVLLTEAQNTIGMLMSYNGENRVYFSAFSAGNSITSRNNDYTMKSLDFFVNTSGNPIELKTVLQLAGANIVTERPEEGEYIDLSPEMLDKNTIIDLLTVKS